MVQFSFDVVVHAWLRATASSQNMIGH